MASLVEQGTIDTRHSQKILNEVIHDSRTVILQAQNPDINEESINIVWDSLGKYLSKSLRNGRGVVVPKFGQFTFTAPMVTLDGVTNPKDRDAQSRIPVFLVSPEFVKGGGIRPGIFYGKTRTIRHYTNTGTNGKMHSVKASYVEVGHNAGVDKDLARTSIERVVKKLATEVRQNGSAHMIIPTVGVIHVRDGVCAVAFDDGITKDIFKITNNKFSANQRKNESKSFLTLDRMDQYQLSQSGYDVDKKDYQSKFMSIGPDA